MKKTLFILFVSQIFFSSCKQGSSSILIQNKKVEATTTINKVSVYTNNTTTIKSRFTPPNGFKRINEDSTSYGFYLRNLPLKKKGTLVKYYNGKIKNKPNVYSAVIDLPIGNKNLHQCADAVIRLRAEYLYQQKEFDKIHFNSTNGFKAHYSEWRKGKRIVVNGNTVSWKQRENTSNTKADFWKYLETIFTYAGTASLEKELTPITIENIKIGDIFIKGGYPGHAIIVVDVAINKATNKKAFILAQSYMPAQEMQVLTNPNNIKISPWFFTSNKKNLITPEWIFKITDLKRFKE